MLTIQIPLEIRPVITLAIPPEIPLWGFPQ
jgi:hypothetical protein